MQEGALFPHLSVLDNIRFGLAHGSGEAHAFELMDLVDLDRSMAARQPTSCPEDSSSAWRSPDRWPAGRG
jgi:ABC-type Fe3+/spermidine/putrescine transport system ATPase subunit